MDAPEIDEKAFQEQLEQSLGVGSEQPLDADPQNLDNEESYPGDLGDEGVTSGDDFEGEDLDDAPAEPHGDLGGAGDLDSTTPLGTVPSQPPGLPPGVTVEQLHAFQEYQKQQAYYQQVAAEQARRQHAQAQQQAQPQGFDWSPPVELTQDLRNALQLRGSSSYSELPVFQREQADKYHAYVTGHWDRWTHDPRSFARDVVLPMLRPDLDQVQGRLNELQAVEFRRNNQSDLGTPEDLNQYLDTLQSIKQSPYQVGLELLRLRKALADQQRSQQEKKTRDRDKNARAQSAKGKSPGRAKQRRSKRKRPLNKKERTDPQALANETIRELKEAGEWTPDLD